MYKKIDRRKKYSLIIDVETTNGLDEPLVYDIGAMVIDNHFNTYETVSYLVEEIFISDSKENSLMNTAYYSWKIPMYAKKIQEREISIKNFMDIRAEILNLMDKYNIKTCIAHNGRFDYKALNTTIQYLTGSKRRNFFRYDTEWICTMAMARNTLCKEVGYINWCKRKPSERLTPTGRISMKAENIYRYISGNHDFIEEHTGLADAQIEAYIYWYSRQKRQKMNKSIFGKKYDQMKEYKRINDIKPRQQTHEQWKIWKWAKYQL